MSCPDFSGIPYDNGNKFLSRGNAKDVAKGVRNHGKDTGADIEKYLPLIEWFYSHDIEKNCRRLFDEDIQAKCREQFPVPAIRGTTTN